MYGNYNKNEELPYIQYLDTNNLCDWAMSQKLPVNNFKWVEDTSKINKEFTKIIMKIIIKDIFLK